MSNEIMAAGGAPGALGYRTRTSWTHSRVFSVPCGVAAGLVLALGIVGCGSARPAPQTAEETPGETDDARYERLVAEGASAWEERSAEDQARIAVDSWKQALEIRGTDAGLWTRLARAYDFLGFGHVQFQTGHEDELRELYRAGQAAGLRALELVSPDFGERMSAGQGVEQALEALTIEAADALYWRTVNIDEWSRIDGFATMSAHRDEIRASMSWLLEHDREHFYGGPDHFFGSVYAVTPTYAGGDLERSREHFDFAISRFPNYLPTHYSFAVEFAIKQQDRSLFRRELQFIIDSDPAAIPEVEPENRVAQRQAQIALSRIDELFTAE